MSYTPEALRRTPIAEWLAERLEDPVDTHGYRLVANNAASELRRLHAENGRLTAEAANRNKRALDGDEAVAALDNVHIHYKKLEHYAWLSTLRTITIGAVKGGTINQITQTAIDQAETSQK